jgi:hypothetical protein
LFLHPPTEYLPGGVGLNTLFGQGRAGDVAAQLLQRLPVIGGAARGSVKTETVDVGAQRLLEVFLFGQSALQRQHVLPGA